MTTRSLRLIIAATLALASVAVPAHAGSTTLNGITMQWPDYPLSGLGGGTPLLSCEPINSPAANLTFSGVPSGATVTVTFGWFDPYAGGLSNQPAVSYSNVTGGSLTVPVPYPATDTWPYWNPTTNERAIGLTASAGVSTNGTVTKLTGAKWWVRCLPPPPPPPDEGGPGGCTPGYWKQQQHLDSWVTYEPTELFVDVFGVVTQFAGTTSLLDAMWLGGGGERALARHAVAALLNAARTDFTYPYTEAEIVAGVQTAYASGDFETFKDALDRANNTGCPLN